MLNIDLYSNGFLVNGELFFDIDEPNTKNYINSISQGSIPPDLQAKLKCKSPKVFLTLNDRGEETYLAPQKTYNPFSGAYRILGSPCPKIVTYEKKAQESLLVVDDNLPTADLQYRLGDGTRRTVTVNPSVHTTANLYAYIQDQTPGHNFSLLSGYPTKQVPCDDELIKNTDLLSNIILQRYI
ncbi:hypothetical protein MXB_3992 [Myxobolus squamalis]|nr:hypothetical protein MXB_3992 [Myxobolus squamalis]